MIKIARFRWRIALICSNHCEKRLLVRALKTGFLTKHLWYIFFVIVINTNKLCMHCRVEVNSTCLALEGAVDIQNWNRAACDTHNKVNTLQEYVWGRKLVMVYSYFIHTDKMIHFTSHVMLMFLLGLLHWILSIIDNRKFLGGPGAVRPECKVVGIIVIATVVPFSCQHWHVKDSAHTFTVCTMVTISKSIHAEIM